MKFLARKFLGGIFLFTLSVAAQTSAPPPRVAGPPTAAITTNRVVVVQKKKTFAYAKSGVFASAAFEGARLNDFFQTGHGDYTAVIEPENIPVNDAAWFAFKIWSKSNQTVHVKLTYKNGQHRYHPKISHDNLNWKPLDSENYKPDVTDHSATLTLAIGPSALFVSAQELFTSKDFARWIEQLCRKPFIHSAVIGKSVRGKPIQKFEISEAADDAHYLLVVSRQHPPEVTGTLALRAFIKTICDDTPLAKKFRSQFKTVVIPLMNPDGVDSGHWRHNANGADLNRDWGQFNQPETRIARDEFLRIEKNSPGKIRFGIDFHSTQHDVFYPFYDSTSRNSDLLDAWLKQIQERVPDYKVNIEPSRNRNDTITLVSVAWMNRQFKIPSVTYEVGDETDRALIEKVATNGATALMELLLEK